MVRVLSEVQGVELRFVQEIPAVHSGCLTKTKALNLQLTSNSNRR